MAASSYVGNVQTVQIISIDSLENKYTTTLNSRIKPLTNATYSNIDSSTRSLISLSENTYQDTHLITDISVNEEIAE